MRRRTGTSFLRVCAWSILACAPLTVACTGSGDVQPPEETIADPTVTDEPVLWQPCGSIQCGTFTVPVDHEGGEKSAGVLDLPLFRRPAADAGAPVLILVGDRTSADRVDTAWGARALAERADLVLGSGAQGFDIVSVALRGSADMPMPEETTAFTGTLDIADDLELLRREGLGLPRVKVMSWGDGATAVAAWVMKRPSVIESAVLDSPADPAVSLTVQTEARIALSSAAAERAVKWCASHLACPVNATPANTLDLLDKRIAEGSAPEGINVAAIARAAETALSAGNPNALWTAITEAADRRGDLLAGLAGRPATGPDVQHLCRDTGAETARVLAALWAASDPRYFRVGSNAERLGVCAGLDVPARPLGEVAENSATVGAEVLVVASGSDPVEPTSIMRAMAKRNKWKWKSSPAVRHLVVGREEVPTAAAMEHLRGD